MFSLSSHGLKVWSNMRRVIKLWKVWSIMAGKKSMETECSRPCWWPSSLVAVVIAGKMKGHARWLHDTSNLFPQLHLKQLSCLESLDRSSTAGNIIFKSHFLGEKSCVDSNGLVISLPFRFGDLARRWDILYLALTVLQMIISFFFFAAISYFFCLPCEQTFTRSKLILVASFMLGVIW